MRKNVLTTEVFIKRVENQHDKHLAITRKYLIGGILDDKRFEKLLNEQEYDAGKFGIALFCEKLILNNGCNLKALEMAALNCRVITAGNYLWNTQGGVK